MQILETGHIYRLANLDGEVDNTITFVNREGDTDHPGTQTQEILRVLIDRTMHCDNCLRWEGNDLIIHHLRMALVLHEARALLRKTEKGLIHPEKVDVDVDGHFRLSLGVAPLDTDNSTYTNKSKRDSPLPHVYERDTPYR